ncbi:MAG: peptidase M15 [Caulobacter sp. 32-67-35]|nr:MAG: peptidase M15 [Caulobacter sp. 32-67-35]
MFAKLRAARTILATIGLVLSCVLAALVPAGSASAQIPYLQLNAAEPKYAAIVIDANSGEVLYDKRADSPRYPASITKVMTVYLAFEALSEGRMKPTDRVVISPRAAAQAPTKLGLPPGDSLSVDEAIRILTVRSANDVAVAMAEKLAGSEARFAALMTLRGQELGMRNTRFVNASGLPDSRQISTARDLAILSRATMRDFPAVRDGRRLIAVVLGGSSTAWRDNNMEDLLLTGFDVLKRRAHGDRTTIAANLFESEPGGPIMRPSTEQGDGEQSGLKIVLTDSPRAQPVKVSPTLKAAKAATKPAKKPKGEWAVQVGAFKSKGLASKQLTLVRGRFAKFVADAEGAVEGAAGGAFRAQFQGLTAEAARSTCAAITAKRQPCMVLSPR